jgi:hypothetical protein
MPATKCSSTLSSTLQTAPPPLPVVDSQILGGQQVPPAAVAWDVLPPNREAIDSREVDDRRTISRNRAPATTFLARAFDD